MKLRLHIEGPKFCLILTTFGLSRETFNKFPNSKLKGNLSSRNPADTFRGYANAPKILVEMAKKTMCSIKCARTRAPFVSS